MKRIRLKSLAVGLCATGLFIGLVSVAQATIAFAPTGLTGFNAEGTGNDGLFFTPTVNISVTALGYVAPGTAGNPVGIYNVGTDTLLASATVTTSGTVSGGFYYTPITPLALTAGTQYVISGYFDNGGATGYMVYGSMNPAADITFDGYKYDNNGGLDLPNIGYTPPIVGPNFQYTPVPEPTTIISGVLMLLPFGASTLRILRKKQVA